jgi:hypothetical protein
MFSFLSVCVDTPIWGLFILCALGPFYKILENKNFGKIYHLIGNNILKFIETFLYYFGKRYLHTRV